MTLADVITSATIGYDLDFDDADESVIVDFRDSNFLVSALAADCCRFSFASFQTMSLVASEIMQRDSVAWSFVKLYYSAFYAGHALIRIFGEGCSFFDRQHASRLIEIGVALGRERSFNIESGLYRCVLNQNSTALKCTRARGTVGGAHEAFWGIFGNRIQVISEAVLTGMLTRSDAQSVFAQLDAFKEIIRRRAGFSWLSATRNDLQYRHHFGVWFPAQIRANDRKILSRLAAKWQHDPMDIDLNERRFGLLGEFVSCCIFIVAFCHAMLERIADRSTEGARSFARIGPMAFLNDIRPRAAMVERA
jgi:hypothetical protein